ncbi:hypothetical protein SJ322_06675 [Serratia marcescens]|uniref:hypothetical protein n=1 Tax=Serratia marcescens TaxID=615 RepID=UPI0029D87FE3|nr:hypothetical protein [Serratia marcescens]MDX7271940.1 hypothetical protein [Serratia marcescens]
MHNNYSLPIDDYPANHNAVKNILKFLNAKSILVLPRQPTGPAGNCYWNVHKTVLAHGGNMVLGWMLEWRPNLIIEAMHHAVYRFDTGEMVDITAPDGQRRQSFTTFVPSDEITIDLNTCPQIPRRHYPLVQDKDLTRYLYLYNKNHQAHSDLTQGLIASNNAIVVEGQVRGNGRITAELERRLKPIIESTAEERSKLRIKLYQRYYS